METELCVRHGAEGNIGAWGDFVTVLVAIDTDRAAWPLGRSGADFIYFI